MEKLAKIDNIYTVLKHPSNVELLDNTFDAVSNNTLYMQQTQQLYSEQKIIQSSENENAELETPLGRLKNDSNSNFIVENDINKNMSSSMNNMNDNYYTISESSIVLCMDVNSASPTTKCQDQKVK